MSSYESEPCSEGEKILEVVVGSGVLIIFEDSISEDGGGMNNEVLVDLDERIVDNLSKGCQLGMKGINGRFQ